MTTTRALHDDQAIALALGAHHLLDAAAGAEQWIAWARQKSIDAGAIIIDGQLVTMPEPRPRAALVPALEPEPDRKPGLVGVVLDPATARKRARGRGVAVIARRGLDAGHHGRLTVRTEAVR